MRSKKSFLWGSSNSEAKGIRWLSWDKLSMLKKYGGMGFRSMYVFNLAMLVKKAWKFIVQPNARY